MPAGRARSSGVATSLQLGAPARRSGTRGLARSTVTRDAGASAGHDAGDAAQVVLDLGYPRRRVEGDRHAAGVEAP